MLKITTQTDATMTTFDLEGSLAGAWVKSWKTVGEEPPTPTGSLE
jgi:hypothetical protein